MAQINSQQKAVLMVTDFVGQPVTGFVVAAEPPTGVVTVRKLSDATWIEAVAPGTATLTVTKGSSVGTIDVTVTAAPLTVALGEPQPL